jgi:hypothetical protein
MSNTAIRTPAKRLTWAGLVRLEPRLAELLAEAKAVRDDGSVPYFCGNACWYGYDGHRGFKPRLVRLVGFGRPGFHDVLSGSTAYDLVYFTIYNVLPSCRGRCGCL